MTEQTYPRYVIGAVERGGKRPNHIVRLDEPLPSEVAPGVTLVQSPSGVGRAAICGTLVRTKGSTAWPPDDEQLLKHPFPISWWLNYTHPKCLELWSKATGQPIPEPEPATKPPHVYEVDVRTDQQIDPPHTLRVRSTGVPVTVEGVSVVYPGTAVIAGEVIKPSPAEMVFLDAAGFTGLRIPIAPDDAMRLTEALRRQDANVPLRRDEPVMEAYARLGRAVLDLQRTLREARA